MQRIDNDSVRGGDVTGKVFKPRAIATNCPHCRRAAIFTSIRFGEVGPMNSVSTSASCPGCRGQVAFFIVNPTGATAQANWEIYMLPELEDYYPSPALSDELPPALRRALISTIDSYNAGLYDATAVAGRRTLEGIFKYLVAEEKRGLVLAKLIDAAAQDIDLAKPLRDLSHAIRGGGNLGAHFDMEHEPNAAVAKQIVELLTYLVSYLYTLPRQIGLLEESLKSAPAGAATSETRAVDDQP